MPESKGKGGYSEEKGKLKLHHCAFCRQEAVPNFNLVQQ